MPPARQAPAGGHLRLGGRPFDRDRGAALLANHGLVTCAATPEKALSNAALVERTVEPYGLVLKAGHWYLVAPRLTFQHLVLFCRVLVATVIGRRMTASR